MSKIKEPDFVVRLFFCYTKVTIFIGGIVYDTFRKSKKFHERTRN